MSAMGDKLRAFAKTLDEYPARGFGVITTDSDTVAITVPMDAIGDEDRLMMQMGLLLSHATNLEIRAIGQTVRKANEVVRLYNEHVTYIVAGMKPLSAFIPPGELS
jgi:hypothetical protein